MPLITNGTVAEADGPNASDVAPELYCAGKSVPKCAGDSVNVPGDSVRNICGGCEDESKFISTNPFICSGTPPKLELLESDLRNPSPFKGTGPTAGLECVELALDCDAEL